MLDIKLVEVGVQFRLPVRVGMDDRTVKIFGYDTVLNEDGHYAAGRCHPVVEGDAKQIGAMFPGRTIVDHTGRRYL